ncbi:energy-coupling factor transporter transmembrane protein EcfT [Cryobacterium sp. Hh7]|uniref:Energy-coupling factor transport system permease protein n=1 Tax=Cryobacterium levicorallinum TaxID=995038 RepID=A0A1I3DC58_9MICO|nr:MULTISPECIES: energy-coupling factor transporter transmembrane component T [Cryobacterium]TFB81814.1 energy-coupling factor transporter transmembrane protein EcfT [Cryobacterium levicorallinum]TFD60630.1 energy-coupling factor transporter transmembrane protein EcfT [Cryobacterium sp. Hh7]GEP28211.1 ABC transporter [Cryobacterium levicorallinum]SFH84315.1 energy-coupling factor transport system permease protein [Cryobacterium levicorallinum]
MSVLTPTRGVRAIDRINPVAKLAAALLLAAVLVLTIDWVSAAVALACEMLLFLWAGLTLRVFLWRTALVWLAAPSTGITTLLYGQASGQEYWSFGLIQVTDGSIDLALATTLRVLAIGLPAVVLFITVDPTDLADGLGQVVHLPARFVLGGLAALRMVGLFIEDWRALGLARRARGVADGAVLRRLGNQTFALLVLSIRRGSKLATAMEARGFGAPIQRTWARSSTFGLREWSLIGIGLMIAVLAVMISVSTGNWNFVFA